MQTHAFTESKEYQQARLCDHAAAVLPAMEDVVGDGHIMSYAYPSIIIMMMQVALREGCHTAESLHHTVKQLIRTNAEKLLEVGMKEAEVRNISLQ